MKTFKKSISTILVVLMLVTSAPLQGFVGMDINLPDWFSGKAEAVVSNYSALAAVDWAKNHWNDTTSVLLGTGYWEQGTGDCANFVSQCIYMGGIDMNSSWNTNGYKAHYDISSDGSFIRATQLYNYVCSIGGTSINNPSPSQASLGDLVFYRNSSTSRISHSAIIVDIVNGVPMVAYHSDSDANGNPIKKQAVEWHCGRTGSNTFLVKMNGSPCIAPNPRSFDVYKVNRSSGVYLYGSASTNSGKISTYINSGSHGEFTHVYSKTSDGQWGYTQRYGKWGWVRLSDFSYQRHVTSYSPSHDMGVWYVTKQANCQQNGIERRDCKRCSHYETRTIGGGHVSTAKSCTERAYCTICGATTSDPLGHNWGSWSTTTSPNCTKPGEKTRKCLRCGKTEVLPIKELGHDYKCSINNATCLTGGSVTYTCSRCNFVLTNSIPASGHKVYEVGDVIEMGTYPQTRVTDANLLNKLNALSFSWSKETYTYKDHWSGDGTITWHLYYSDVLYNGEYYRAVKYTDYRPQTYQIQEINGYFINNVYWFKYEPIEWIIIDEQKGLIVSRYMLDSQAFSNTMFDIDDPNDSDGDGWNLTSYIDSAHTKFANDYKYSSIRSWLTGTFYNKAFSTSDKNRILSTSLDNSSYIPGSKYDSESTNDRIFLLSLSEHHNVRDVLSPTIHNRVTGTEYALCVGLEDTEAYWWLRTAGKASPEACASFGSYNWTEEYYVEMAVNGVRPAMRINMYANNEKNLYIEPDCTTAGYSGKTVCTICGATIKAAEDIPALGHNFDGGIIYKDPTCTESGIIIYSCQRDGCGVQKTETIPPLGHKMTSTLGWNPTCTETGMTSGNYCERCGYGNKPVIIPALGHSGLDENGEEVWITVQEASCGIAGKEELHCQRTFGGEKCNHLIDERFIEPFEPKYSILVAEEDPTCTLPGWKKYSCEICHGTAKEHYDVVDIEPNGHDWVKEIEKATCTKSGREYQVCRVCGEEELIKILNPIGHLEGATYTIYETCTTDGYKGWDCQRDDCDHIEKLEEYSKTGHTYVAEETKNSCTTGGFIICTCYNSNKNTGATCLDQYTDGETNPLGHSMSQFVSNNDATHTANCQRDNCDYFETQDCIFGEWVIIKGATCTEVGSKERKCTVCKYTEIAEIEPKGHDYVEGDIIPATCSFVEGVYMVCQNDSSHKYKKDIGTEPLGHDFTEKIIDDLHLVKNATCTERAVYKYDCARNGENADDGIACTKQSSNTFEYGEPLGHAWDDGVINPESTCKLHGTKTYTCQNDNSHKKTESVALNPNNHVGEIYIKDAKTETCTADGYTGDKYCSDCDELLEKGEAIAKLGHDMGKWSDNKNGTHTRECQRNNGCTYKETNNCTFGNWVVTKEATCTTKGSKERVCTVCGYKETAVIELKAHTPGEAVIENEVAPKCEEKGSYDEVVYCTECPEELSREKKEIPATGHDWDNGVINPESTCKLHGTKTYTCQNDNSHKKTESVALNPNNHVGETYIKNAKTETCTEDGYTGDEYCSDCDELLEKGEAIAKLGHDMGEWSDNNNGTHTRECQRDNGCTYTETENCTFGNWIITKEATCTAKGSKERVCTVCGYKETAEIQLKEHITGEAVIENEVAPKCEVKGSYDEVVYCTECTKELSRVKKDIAPIGHDWDNGVINPESTCKLHGTKTYTCQNDNSHKKTESVALNPNNHVGETYIKNAKTETCTEDGYTGDKYCSDCDALLEKGEPIDKLGHNMSKWSSNNDATHTRDCQRENGCTYTENEKCSFGDWIVTKEATCTEKGLKERLCTVCGYEETAEIEFKEHTPDEAVIENRVAPKCEEKGSYDQVVYCTECPKELSREEKEIPAHGHDYHKVDEKSKAPDYGVAGYDYYECNYDASHNYNVDIDALVKTTFTATFYVTAPFWSEPKLVDSVPFEQGATYVDEPKVESYDNYTFEWEDYKSRLKDEDITIYGAYTLIEPDNVTELEPKKEAKDLGDGIANITLEARAESKIIKVVTAKPVDVILVLDQSGSMAETLSSDGTTKRDALVECADDFVEALYTNAKVTGLNHRVAIVGFAGSEKSSSTYKNTEIITTSDLKPINYNSNPSDEAYKNALMPIMDDNLVKNSVFDKILDVDKNYIDASGATAAHLGLKMAKNIFAQHDKEDRDRIVLFITDGVPTHTNDSSQDNITEVAALAITEANDLKYKQNANIYSIGVHTDTNPDAEFTSSENGVTKRGSKISYDFNRFLHAVSSNYPYAKSIKVSEMGEGNKKAGYYFAVNNTDNLSSIFTKILYGKVYEVVSFDKVTLFDTISKEFTLTLEQEIEMRERLIKEYGMKNEDITVKRNTDGTTSLRFENVRVQKVFNADSSMYYSAKVSFNVSANEASLGKMGEVKTNTEDAGIEYDGTAVDKFEVQSINLEADRKIVVFTINGVVYRIDEANLGERVVAPVTEFAQWNIPESTVVTGNCAVFEANVIDSKEYVVTWNSEGTTKTETYSFGSVITAPEATDKEGYDFLRWSPTVPETMPNYNMSFTAIYTPEHIHQYNEIKNYGKCTEGIKTVYKCVCGDSYEEIAEVKDHSVKAVITKTGGGTLIEKVTCDVCGASNGQEITYKVTYSENSQYGLPKTYVLDLSLKESDILVQPDGTIKIRFYLGENIDKNYMVKRINENGNSYNYTPIKENGYLIFDADHFSFYVVTEIDETTDKPSEELSYDEIYCISNGHSYTSKVTAPTCTVKGYTTHTCASCGDVYTDSETSALGHKMSAYVVTKEPTCTDKGTEMSTCNVCTHTETRTINANGHNYKDGVCTGCGKNKVENCTHMCHKGGFMGFIWKIVRFFWKLFRMNPICECGVKHY